MPKKKDTISTENNIAKTNYKIIGFGNIYMSDDGVGIRVIEEIKKRNLFNNYDNVILIEGETSGVDLIFMINDSDKVIIIDAIDAGQDIGEIVKFSINDIENNQTKDKFKSFSLHDVNLLDVFNLIKKLQLKNEITIIGIKPKVLDYGDKLSPEVENKIDNIISLIQNEVDN